MAFGLSTQVNALNNGGTDLQGNRGTAANPLYIFAEPTAVAGSAAKMSVVMTDPSQVAAAAAGRGSGDNANAVALSALRNAGIIAGLTPSGLYSSFVTVLGATVGSGEDRKSGTITRERLFTQLQTARNALWGVI